MKGSRDIRCDICPHECRLKEGGLGYCGVRTSDGTRVVSLNYGRATALALDPIEKKPLARFHRGSKVLSYGSFGCNLRCPFCQNADIATARADDAPPTRYLSPEELVSRALALKPKGNVGIAYTYNEPFIAWEYLMDCARLAHEHDLYNVVVSNGYILPAPWEAALPHIDAANIDLKCFTEEGYRSLGAPGGLEVVKGSIQSAVESGTHVEVTTLVVPGLSDDEQLFEQECKWLAQEVGTEVPLHISRFFPCHRAMDKSPTEIALLERLEAIARSYLEHVYLGNV